MTSHSKIIWRGAPAAALLVLAGVGVGLLLAEQLTLQLVWSVVIPLVPASLAISPALWRNVCPLATLETAVGPTRGPRLEGAGATRAQWIGMLLLFVLVPLRRVLFNVDGLATLGLVGASGVAAVAFGLRRPLKAGFCNAFCPVLPVERLYGQSPVLAVANPRCVPCTLCTPVGCSDLAASKTVAQLLGPARRTLAWLRTPFGAFAGTFPGLVLAYFLAADGDPLAEIYGRVALLAAGSWLLTAGVSALTRADARVVVRAAAALALGLYYWYAATGMATALGVAALVWPVRIAGLTVALVLLTVRRGLRYRGPIAPAAPAG